MKYKMFAVKDVHTGYLAPTLEINENVAIRNFVEMVSKTGVVKQNAKDFDLREIGEYDTESGIIYNVDEKVVYTGISAVAYLKEVE